MSDKLTILQIIGSSVLHRLRTRLAGSGSRQQDLENIFLVVSDSSSVDVSAKVSSWQLSKGVSNEQK
jgi:hypothetical protein